ALASASKNLARTLAPEGIAATTVAPGTVMSPVLGAYLETADPADLAEGPLGAAYPPMTRAFGGTNALARTGTAEEVAPPGGLLVLSLVPRHGARELRGPRDRGGDEPPLRERQGRPRGTSRRRRYLHAGRASDDRTRRLADDGVAHARRPAVLRWDLLPEGGPSGHGGVRPRHGGSRRRVAQPPSRPPHPSRQAARRARPHRDPPARWGERDRARDGDPRPSGSAGPGAVRRPLRRVRTRAQVPAGD